MPGRALLMVGLFVGVTTLPMVAAAADAETCIDRMLREMGWVDDGSAELGVIDPLTPGAEAAPSSNDLHACVGKIQPGAQMTIGCTMNFIFRDQVARLYFGTAGHCFDGNGVGRTAGIVNVGNNVGTVVYDGHRNPGDVPDFALLRVDPAFYADIDPTMCHWGGPAGLNTFPSFGQTTHIYGFGLVYGQAAVTRARVGDVMGATSSEVTYLGFAQPGDSGAPVVTGDGKAAGIHVRSSLSIPGVIRIDPSPKYMTRVDAAIAGAEAATGLDLTLVDGNEPFNLLGY
ncbi:MAG TPA: hypothetical protein VGR28_01870 [Candidatus Thermoplasmatota archaeon]|nr:hypothetical protein [Candidatus Thermoplasmatota archaeon]